MVETRSTAAAEGLGVELQLLVIVARDDALIIREGAVDELGGEHQIARGETDLGGRERHLDSAVDTFEQLHHLQHRLPRHDHAGHALGTVGPCDLGLGQPVAVGRHRAQQVAVRHVVEIDAVEVVAGLLGGDGEARLLDQALEVARGDGEAVGEVARGEIREIFRRQRLQREARAAGEDRHPLAVTRLLELELGAIGELPHDVVEHVGGHRGGAGLGDLGGHAFDDLDVEIGGGQLQRGPSPACKQHVGQDGNGVAALHDALHMGERLAERLTSRS